MLRAGIVAVVVVLVALGMVSSVPTWGWKAMRLPRGARLPVLAGVGLFAAALAQLPWATLAGVCVAYVVAAPFAVVSFRRRLARG
jgi:CDP-diacylglycerol--serine O-phosphatidyltransferase